MTNIKRITQVIRVLAKNNLASVLCKYGFAWYLPLFKRKTGPIPPDIPQKLRKSMEELGGAYIKLGQLLSIRPDLIPEEYCQEFSKLQDNVPPENIATIEKVIQEEFKKPNIFSHIDPRPIGSASIAQVHKARTRDKRAVAIKVQRPNVAEQFAQDMAVIRYIAQKLQKRIPEFNPIIIAEEFERYTEKELNFITEASHIEDIGKALTTRQVIVPKVYWETTTAKVLTMDYLEGKKLSQIKITKQPAASKLLLNAFLEQVFENGVFHADLHPGNILLLKNNKIGLIDFGIVGRIDPKTRKLGIQLYNSIIERDPQKIAEILVKYGTLSRKTNVQEFVRDTSNLVDEWWETHPQQRRVTKLMQQLFVLCTSHNITMPRDIILLGKGMVTVESTARKLNPDFNFVKYSQPKIEEIMKQQKTTKVNVKRFKEKSKLFADAIMHLPIKTLEAIEDVKRKGITLDVDDTNFRHIGKDINLSSNRLSYAIVAAALILASSMMIEIGPRIGTYSIISITALSIASIFVVALFVSVAKEGLPKYDKH